MKTIPHGETMIHNVPKGTQINIIISPPRLHVGLRYFIPLGFINNAFVPPLILHGNVMELIRLGITPRCNTTRYPSSMRAHILSKVHWPSSTTDFYSVSISPAYGPSPHPELITPPATYIKMKTKAFPRRGMNVISLEFKPRNLKVLLSPLDEDVHVFAIFDD